MDNQKPQEPIKITRKEIFNGVELETIYRETARPVDPDASLDRNEMESLGFGICGKFNQRTYEAAPGILCDQDVPVRMRDGITIYVDIYRPQDQVNIPAIISWSFFGKRPSEGLNEWKVMGVPPGTLSDLAKFESPDPAFWCYQGYAVANVDPRGVGHSEGDINVLGTQDGRDGYDFIEWLASQWWCNGKVGMSGNSVVAMTQWRIAAQQPPHLTCIAPWEGGSDPYREFFYEGGVPALNFQGYIVGQLTGNGYIDDVFAMGEKYRLMNAYWEDKIPDFSRITVPTYTTVCWNHFHLRGSMNAFRKIATRKKWIRCHREFEWPDLYTHEYLQELKQFFDRYLKNIHNGWEMTPRVRVEVQDAYEHLYQKNRGETSFPLKRTIYKKLYVDAANQALSYEPVETASSYSYDIKDGICNLDIKFKEDTEITGFMKLRLWVEADGHDDMDMFINIQKLSTKGEWLPVSVLDEAHPGAWGKLRVSHRALDLELSTNFEPVYAHRKEEKLHPGEIVPVEIAIVPHSRFWHKGQYLRVQIAGRYIREGWFEPLSWETDNKGNHIIHSGGKYDSYLQIPYIPAKFVDGDCVYR